MWGLIYLSCYQEQTWWTIIKICSFFFMLSVFHCCFSFVLLFIFMAQQYYMTSSSADFLCLSAETIVSRLLFRVYMYHDDVIKWKHFPRYWPFVRGIHRSPVNSPHKRQWRGALMFSLICVWMNGWVNNRQAGDMRRYHAHYDVIVIVIFASPSMVDGKPSISMS